jgi:hypothetical protein
MAERALELIEDAAAKYRIPENPTAFAAFCTGLLYGVSGQVLNAREEKDERFSRHTLADGSHFVGDNLSGLYAATCPCGWHEKECNDEQG